MTDRKTQEISNIVGRLLEEKEIDAVFGGGMETTTPGGSFTLKCDYPPGYGKKGGAFWLSTE